MISKALIEAEVRDAPTELLEQVFDSACKDKGSAIKWKRETSEALVVVVGLELRRRYAAIDSAKRAAVAKLIADSVHTVSNSGIKEG